MSTIPEPGPPSRPDLPVLATAAPPVIADVNRAPVTSPSGLTRWRLAVAFAVAGVSDVLAVAVTLAPPFEWALDLATALVLFVLLGRRWLLLPALIMEAIPGLWVFPFWVLVVGAIAVTGQIKPKR